MRVDLHMHSTCSDGEFTPTELAEKIRELNLDYVALTDHDTVKGVAEFIKACKSFGIKPIPGIELSTKDKKEVHVLGYNIDYENPLFLKELEKVQEYREIRNKEIIKNLNKLGMDISNEDIKPENGETIGRMHIAKVMMSKGYIKNLNQAFDEYLGNGKKAYATTDRMSTENGIKLIQKFGGKAVLAHPKRMGLDYYNLKNSVERFKSYGLDGIEAYYHSHSKKDVKDVLRLARNNDLFPTCGSDFHNDGRPNKIGTVETPEDFNVHSLIK